MVRIRKVSQFVPLGVISLITSICVFFLTLWLFPFTTALRETVGVGENAKQVNWNLLEGVTGLVTMSLFIGGILFTWLGYIENKEKEKRETTEYFVKRYKEMYDLLMKPDALAARRWVILNLPTLEDMGNDKDAWLECVNKRISQAPRGWKGERPPGKEYIKEILNVFDFLGFVAQRDWDMDKELLMWMSPFVAKVWERIGQYVEEEARQRNEPDFYQSARVLGNYCLELRKKQYPRPNIITNAT